MLFQAFKKKWGFQNVCNEKKQTHFDVMVNNIVSFSLLSLILAKAVCYFAVFLFFDQNACKQHLDRYLKNCLILSHEKNEIIGGVQCLSFEMKLFVIKTKELVVLKHVQLWFHAICSTSEKSGSRANFFTDVYACEPDFVCF